MKYWKYVQTFTEVRVIGVDDRAIRLPSGRAYLASWRICAGAAGTESAIMWIELNDSRTHVLAVLIDDQFSGKLLHHGLADFIAGSVPDVHHVVVSLLRGHQTRRVLLYRFP